MTAEEDARALWAKVSAAGEEAARMALTMTNVEKFDALCRWQACGFVHPLTCGGGGGPCSGVQLGVSLDPANGLGLRCQDCGRFQPEAQIPPVCFTMTEADVSRTNERYKQ